MLLFADHHSLSWSVMKIKEKVQKVQIARLKLKTTSMQFLPFINGNNSKEGNKTHSMADIIKMRCVILILLIPVIMPMLASETRKSIFFCIKQYGWKNYIVPHNMNGLSIFSWYLSINRNSFFNSLHVRVEHVFIKMFK